MSVHDEHMDIDREALNRTHKAAVIARNVISAGLDDDLPLLDSPLVRKSLLAVVVKPGGGRWFEASEQTWAEVKVLVEVLRG